MTRFIPALPGDASTIARLRQQCWAATYRGIYPDEMIDQFDFAWHERQDLARINSDQYEVFLIQSDEIPVGYLTIQDSQPPHLLSLYLLPEYQRQGIGRMAFAHMAEFCKVRNQPIFLCQCQPENNAALSFYQRMGGTVIARDEGNKEAYMNSITLEFNVNKEA